MMQIAARRVYLAVPCAAALVAPTLAMLLGIAPPSAAFGEPLLVLESASR